jgi:mono/diheme cytochrome c family protein
MMNSTIVKSFAWGAISAYVFAALVFASAAWLGVLPVQADAVPSRLEAVALGAALRAAVGRHAPGGPNPVPASEQNLFEGAKLYRQMCSSCHSLSAGSPNDYGQSFYPPAPNLPQRGTQYSDTQTFWIVKHGIRNTAMPAWNKLLSDAEIWQLVTLIKSPRGFMDIIPEIR